MHWPRLHLCRDREPASRCHQKCANKRTFSTEPYLECQYVRRLSFAIERRHNTHVVAADKLKRTGRWRSWKIENLCFHAHLKETALSTETIVTLRVTIHKQSYAIVDCMILSGDTHRRYTNELQFFEMPQSRSNTRSYPNMRMAMI